MCLRQHLYLLSKIFLVFYVRWGCRIHFVNHMQRSKYMESNSIFIHEESTLTRYKLVIELVFDNENSEKVIILNKIHIHAKTKKTKEKKYRIQSRVYFLSI